MMLTPRTYANHNRGLFVKEARSRAFHNSLVKLTRISRIIASLQGLEAAIMKTTNRKDKNWLKR